MAMQGLSTEDAAAGESLSDEPVNLTNKSVIKATSLLRELGRNRNGVTVTALAQAVGMTRPTAFRLLLSLEQTGFVDRTDSRYKLGWRMAMLGRLADPYVGVISQTQPILDESALKLNETVGFAVVRGGVKTAYDVIAEASGSRVLNSSQLYVGRDYPLHATAAGQVLLAQCDDQEIASFLPEVLESYTPNTIVRRDALIEEVHRVRDRGYAVLDNEYETGLFAVACPVQEFDGKLIGIVIVQGPTERLKSDSLSGTIDLLKEAADQIASVLA
ncbi:IclR family transcriptional regulator [Paenarthrobacter nitroguajacolicus]